MNWNCRLAYAMLAWLWACCVLPAQDLPRFREHVLTRDLKLGYQLVAADLNGDGKKDLVIVDEMSSELLWFENQHPAWKRHVLAANVPRPINADCWDCDGDGSPEIVLAYRFDPSPQKSVGNVTLFKRGTDVRQPWLPREIDRVSTAHRVRWIDPEGNGKKVLLVAPLVGPRYPDVFADPVPIYLYRPGEWKRELLTNLPRGILHAIYPVHGEKGNRQHLLMASHVGLQRGEFLDGKWMVTQLAKGNPQPFPKCGSSEVRAGRFGQDRFLVAIEPYHGNQVVVYIPQEMEWKRIVLEDSMDNGHALAVGDLDGDGRDEIVTGFRGKGHKLWVFQTTDATGEHWRKTVLDDGGSAGADCIIDDFTGDGRPDIAVIGASTRNVKLFENLGK